MQLAERDPDVLAEELRRRLGAAMREAGREVGVLVTGDVESALLCAIAASGGLGVSTFAVGHDELALERARLVSDQYDTPHEEMLLPGDLAECLERLAAATAEPPADPLVLQRFLAAEMAAGSVPVLVTAAGARELLSARPALLRRREDPPPPPAGALPVDGPVAECMPYLDDRVVELARGLAPRLKARGITSKPLLRRAALPLLPGALVHAPDRHPRAVREFASQVADRASLWSAS